MTTPKNDPTIQTITTLKGSELARGDRVYVRDNGGVWKTAHITGLSASHAIVRRYDTETPRPLRPDQGEARVVTCIVPNNRPNAT